MQIQKHIFLSILLLILTSTLAFSFSTTDLTNLLGGESTALAPSDIDTTQVSNGLNDFTFSLVDTSASTVSHQNMWASAYIGQLLAVPPHFGGGVSVGAAQLKAGGLSNALKQMGIQYDVSNLYLPTLTIDAKIGGLILPFDLGVHGMIIDTPIDFSVLDYNFSVNYGTVGADIRIPILKQGIIAPAISLGLGYAYSKGSIGVNIQEGFGSVNAGYQAQILQATVQISKKILIVEPFLGVRGTLSSSKRNWSWAYDASKGFTDAQIAVLTSNGVSLDALKSSDSLPETEWSSFWDIDAANPNYTAQIYAGCGIDFLFIAQCTVNASYDIVNDIWAGGISLRVKL